MLIDKYQRPYGLVAEVATVSDLPEGYEASVEVAVPCVGVYWEILDTEEELIATGFESSEHKAYFAIYPAAQALQVTKPTVCHEAQGGPCSQGLVTDHNQLRGFRAPACSLAEWARALSFTRHRERGEYDLSRTSSSQPPSSEGICPVG